MSDGVRSGAQAVLARRSFTLDDQEWFARTSGDRNPLHLDEIAARRALFGRVAVHGVHGLLWAIDSWCAAHRGGRPSRIVAAFNKPIFLDEDVDVVVGREDEWRTQLKIVMGATTLTSITLDRSEGRSPDASHPTVAADDAADAIRESPHDLTLDEMEDRTGRLRVPDRTAAWRRAFPSLSRAAGPWAIAHIAGLSYLVGMECPGMHSLFGGFDVVVDPTGTAGAYDWRVTRADQRISIVQLQVGPGQVAGSVNAFARPRPSSQPGTAEVARHVGRGEFAGVRALVVGGSRGLGEVTAKLLGAGGAHVVVTWHAGGADAADVVRDINVAGGSAAAVHLDVGDPSAMGAALDPAGPTHLFYFASPRITSRRLVGFDRRQFDTFVDVFVTGFIDVATVAAASNAGRLAAFYPSTVFVHEGGSDLVEYAAAKAAGEIAATQWAASAKLATVVVERLPRLNTDQTAGLRAEGFEDAVPVLLAAIRQTVRAGRQLADQPSVS